MDEGTKRELNGGSLSISNGNGGQRVKLSGSDGYASIDAALKTE